MNAKYKIPEGSSNDDYYKERAIFYSTDCPTIEEIKFVIDYYRKGIGHYNEGCMCYLCMWNQFWPIIKIIQRALKHYKKDNDINWQIESIIKTLKLNV